MAKEAYEHTYTPEICGVRKCQERPTKCAKRPIHLAKEAYEHTYIPEVCSMRKGQERPTILGLLVLLCTYSIYRGIHPFIEAYIHL